MDNKWEAKKEKYQRAPWTSFLLEKDDDNENDALKMDSEHGEKFSDASSSNTDDKNAGQSTD